MYRHVVSTSAFDFCQLLLQGKFGNIFIPVTITQSCRNDNCLFWYVGIEIELEYEWLSLEITISRYNLVFLILCLL